MHDYWRKRFGNWSDPEMYELARINHYDAVHEIGMSLDSDPEVWNAADWEDFEPWDMDAAEGASNPLPSMKPSKTS